MIKLATRKEGDVIVAYFSILAAKGVTCTGFEEFLLKDKN